MAQTTAIALEGTYWRLSELRGAAVVASGGRAPHIVLHAGTSRVAGYGGCNRFFASYELAGEDLSITPLGGGRANCPEASNLERSFISELAAVSRYELDADHLRFVTRDERILLFKAVER